MTIAQQMTSASQQLYGRAKKIIPGGTQLLSKRPEMFAPDQWPAYFQSAQGCEIKDLDGNHYIDMTTMGLGACLLGYRHPEVTDAVIKCVQKGSMCTLNSPDEVHLAEALIELHPWADNARFARSGGEAMAIAVRIARAATGRDVIAFCGYHGWHDWYLAANRVDEGSSDVLRGHLLSGLSVDGVPSCLAGTAMPFSYNKLDELEAILYKHSQKLAAVVMEPTRSVDPQPGFLEGVRQLCDKSGAVLVVDEITAGWRLHYGGAHMKYGLTPDIAVFAKAIGNGHPIAAIIGKSEIMQAAQATFISSTYWTESVGAVAALAVIEQLRDVDAPEHVKKIGLAFRDGLTKIATKHEIPLVVSGAPALTSIGFACPESAALITLLTVRMLDRGILAGASFYPSLAHKLKHVENYLAAAEEVFVELAESFRAGDAVRRIGGPIKHTGFARLA